MRQKQVAEQKHTQKLTAYQQQSLAVLSLRADDLNDLIAEMSERNPLLETDWSGTRQYVTDAATYETVPDRENPLDDLSFQCHVACKEPALLPICDFLITSLDERGYLDISVRDAAKHLRVSEIAVKRALMLLQSLEPAGVGARNLRESLYLQLKRQPTLNPLALTIVRNQFNALAGRDYTAIATALSVSEAAVASAVREIQLLNPTPFSCLMGEATRYAIPELYVYVKGGEPVVTLLARTPVLRITPSVSLNNVDDTVKLWAASLMDEALQLIVAVQRRQDTLLSIGKSIVLAQRAFFTEGHPLVALTQEAVASELSISISTVSRAIREQYLQFNEKVYPLKRFFPSHVAAGGSKDEIQNVIRSVIQKESPLHPISDGQIARYLASAGQSVSRRTVTKYRQELGILQASEREKKTQ